MRILAIEPYYGGSHRAFLDQWMERSEHQWELLTLPAHHWKWRMRHAGIWGAERLVQRARDGGQWDLLLASDMLDLAQLLGLADSSISELPRVVYFHENQLTYPDRFAAERDLHFALSNFTSALAANRVWFNSDFHRTEFLQAARDWLQAMPDFAPLSQLAEIESKSSVQSPGVDVHGLRRVVRPGPLRIAWAARWEHDKNPETFFQALRLLKDRQLDFRLTVCGEQFRKMPDVFTPAREEFASHIDHWGQAPSHREYLSRLSHNDIFVSTALHEFFGLSVMESIAIGLRPLLPDRLSYPELLGRDRGVETREFFYDGTATDLADRLAQLARDPERIRGTAASNILTAAADRYRWSSRAPAMDHAIAAVVRQTA